MPNSASNIHTVTKLWTELDNLKDVLTKEQSAAWRLLNCRYRILRMRTEVSDEQVVQFKMLTETFQRLIYSSEAYSYK